MYTTMGQGEQIVIVGPQHAKNERMCAFLERQTAIPCRVVAQRQQCSAPRQGERVLVLHDCEDLPEATIARLLNSGDAAPAPREIGALYNLDQQATVEYQALQAGIRGFFYRHEPAELVARGVPELFGGTLWIPRRKMEEIVLAPTRQATTAAAPLTEREREILSLVSTGANNDRISQQLAISPHTVKTHIYNIFKKLDVTNRMEAALWFLRQQEAGRQADEK